MEQQTLAVHGAYSGAYDRSEASSIAQTVAFGYPTAREIADVFAGRAPGHTYTRISNPTTSVLEGRLAGLEGGVACVATSSGMAAITSVMLALLQPGDEIVSARGIFGGTVSLFENVLSRFGITARYAEGDDAADYAGVVGDKTRLIFAESISNPGMGIPDIPAIGLVARELNVPFVLDATLTPPVIARCGSLGADIVVHSTSKFINGHGTAIGGAIIDTGNYCWSSGRFAEVAKLSRRLGEFAFAAYLRNTVCRDTGGCPAPMNSFLMLQGLDTLGPRVKVHCANALGLAQFLEGHSKVEWVNYPGLPGSPYRSRADALFGGVGGAVFTFGLGGKDRSFQFMDALRMARIMTNMGDVKTLVVHPASTIFHEYGPEKRASMGVGEDMVRVSAGIEDIKDILSDFEQALGQV